VHHALDFGEGTPQSPWIEIPEDDLPEDQMADIQASPETDSRHEEMNGLNVMISGFEEDMLDGDLAFDFEAFVDQSGMGSIGLTEEETR